jgi:hypothetical protein
MYVNFYATFDVTIFIRVFFKKLVISLPDKKFPEFCES